MINAVCKGESSSLDEISEEDSQTVTELLGYQEYYRSEDYLESEGELDFD